MNIEIRYSQASTMTHPFREAYLDSLIESQEMFLELSIPATTCHHILLNGTRVGYAAITDDGVLWEYHLSPIAVHANTEIFRALIDATQIKKAYIKSFDHVALSASAANHRKLTIAGHLYRDRLHPPHFSLPDSVAPRFATPSDHADIAAVNEQVFESDDEICLYIRKRRIILFHKNNHLCGFGIFGRVIPHRPEFDVGMLVAKPYRNNGFGTSFLAHTSNHVKAKGGRPTMGCAVDNLASKKTIEKLGYISKYKMFLFDF